MRPEKTKASLSQENNLYFLKKYILRVVISHVSHNSDAFDKLFAGDIILSINLVDFRRGTGIFTGILKIKDGQGTLRESPAIFYPDLGRQIECRDCTVFPSHRILGQRD